jgi:guanylate kinase
MSSKQKTVFHAWIISGPSGSGKTTLCEALLKDPYWQKRLLKSVSYTTRALRPGEQEGKDYHFISAEAFLSLKRRGAFLESEQIFDYYYGTPKKFTQEAKSAGKDLLLCIDVRGSQTIKKFFKKKATSIFILPPKQEVLLERLEKRSTENRGEMRKRLRRVRTELAYLKNYDYVIVNDDFNEALNKIKSILAAKMCEVK